MRQEQGLITYAAALPTFLVSCNLVAETIMVGTGPANLFTDIQAGTDEVESNLTQLRGLCRDEQSANDEEVKALRAEAEGLMEGGKK